MSTPLAGPPQDRAFSNLTVGNLNVLASSVSQQTAMLQQQVDGVIQALEVQAAEIKAIEEELIMKQSHDGVSGQDPLLVNIASAVNPAFGAKARGDTFSVSIPLGKAMDSAWIVLPTNRQNGLQIGWRGMDQGYFFSQSNSGVFQFPQSTPMAIGAPYMLDAYNFNSFTQPSNLGAFNATLTNDAFSGARSTVLYVTKDPTAAKRSSVAMFEYDPRANSYPYAYVFLYTPNKAATQVTKTYTELNNMLIGCYQSTGNAALDPFSGKHANMSFNFFNPVTNRADGLPAVVQQMYLEDDPSPSIKSKLTIQFKMVDATLAGSSFAEYTTYVMPPPGPYAANTGSFKTLPNHSFMVYPA